MKLSTTLAWQQYHHSFEYRQLLRVQHIREYIGNGPIQQQFVLQLLQLSVLQQV